MNEERDFLRGISPPNDAPLTVAAMMQRKEERRGEERRGEERGAKRERRPSIIYHAAIICSGARGGFMNWREEGWRDGDGLSGWLGGMVSNCPQLNIRLMAMSTRFMPA